ncbi:Lar family restriction alleviation protein [Proteus terrae]|uniref:Lar family restriction alleviation protein n=1 Tax=Proteus terrae TaxID=1574161 RepID=UPI00288C20FF|nr:Lar family restriction alleviation protein [Proteus terrae]
MNNKNCPFCNSKKLEVMQVMSNTFTRCRMCGGRGPVTNDSDNAVTAWNKRKGEKMLTKYMLFVGFWFVVMLAIGLWGTYA